MDDCVNFTLNEMDLEFRIFLKFCTWKSISGIGYLNLKQDNRKDRLAIDPNCKTTE